MNQIVEQTRGILSQLGFLPIILFVTFIALYVYWREARYTNKNQNSIFDNFIFSTVIMVIWGRLSYLFSNPESYEGLIWSVFPYERYPDGFYLFRLLPWRYFRIWDGEFLFTGLFVGLIFSAFLYSIFAKKWRWREMMGAVVSCSAVYLGGLLFFLGFISQTQLIINQSITILSLSLMYFVIARLLGKTLYKKNGKLWEKLNYYTIFLYTLIISIYIPSVLLKSDITLWDRYNLLAFSFFSIISMIIFVIDVMRKEVKINTKYRSRSVSISTNQPIKL